MPTEGLAKHRLRFSHMDVQANDQLFAQDVAHGLAAPQKWLPPKYFYDARGCQLYEQICALPEYYPYRAEQEILGTYAAQIHAEIGHLPLVELGAGSATKTRYLLDAYEWAGRPFTYCPVDIARDALWDTASQLLQEYNKAEIHALHADFAGQPEVVQTFQLERKAVAFFGSSLGNFTPAESVAFLQHLAALLGPEDVFLLGIDLKKSPAILLPAYDDAQGITAAFNRNVLQRINRQLGGRFDLHSFEHLALYNEALGCIEMHLRSLRAQRVPIVQIEQVVSFDKDETIHTESSYKYSVDDIRDLGAQANLVLRRTWFDSRRWFLLALFRPFTAREMVP